MTQTISIPNRAQTVGRFGEHLVSYWLARSGYEVAIIDYTGIDVIARDPESKNLLGITVKTRLRTKGKATSVALFKGNDRDKVNVVCKAFNCQPWLAVYVECEDTADLYLTSLKHYDKHYRRKGLKKEAWYMTADDRRKYNRDQFVKHVAITFDHLGWLSQVPFKS